MAKTSRGACRYEDTEAPAAAVVAVVPPRCGAGSRGGARLPLLQLQRLSLAPGHHRWRVQCTSGASRSFFFFFFNHLTEEEKYSALSATRKTNKEMEMKKNPIKVA